MGNKNTAKIVLKRRSRLSVCMGLAFLCLSIWFSVPAAAAEMEGEGGFVLPEFYPDQFDGTGRIDRIALDEVVIDDSLYRFSPYAEYATPTDRHALRAWFQVGNRVGYVTNENHEIISLWLIE
jgi:hypothetical protein